MRSNNSTIVHQAPDSFHKAHVHFFDYLESFHGLEDQKDYSSQHNEIMERLRHQYLHENNWEDNLCFRSCFKLKDKSYVDFCLQKKCGGASFKDAALRLGYVKTDSHQPKAVAHHGHH